MSPRVLCRLVSSVALTALALATPLAAQDTKRAADGIIDVLRERFDEDTELYGSPSDTARVLSALTRSPRRYTELDGPFIRRAAAKIAGDDSLSPAQRALALAGMITPTMVAARDRALEQLVAIPAGDYGLDEWLALRTFEALDYELPGDAWRAARPRTPAERVLVAPDATAIAAPATTDVSAWTAWARAARLRGVTLDHASLPVLPELDRGATTAALLDDLETVIACHGVDAPRSDDEAPPLPALMAAGRTLDEARRAAWSFLESHQVDGTFGLELGPPSAHEPELGITALNLLAALTLVEDLGLERPRWIDRGLDFVASHAKPDGAIYRFGLAVYTTSVSIEALQRGGRPEHQPLVAAGQQFLITAQSDEGEGYSSIDDPHYGGIGYGGDERPDMSNHQMALDALARTGTPDDHPVFDKALQFAEKNQNDGEANPQEWPRRGGGRLVAGTDGGGTYMPGNSPAGEEKIAEGVYVARSYGSMTYALTKSFLLCGVDPEDRRVRAAIGWLADNFSVEVNPGFDPPEKGGDGLYYYYMAMARTLALVDDAAFVTRDGRRVDWRGQLLRHLVDHQRLDGSWINEQSPRWWEGAPTLATAYAILALDDAEQG